MQLVELSEYDLTLDFFPHRKEGEDPIRTPGVHLTDIIKDIMETSGMQRTVSGNVWGMDQLNLAAEVGFMWEEILSNAMKDRLPYRIGEVTVDGIIMSPDGLEVDEEEEENGGLVLGEYKAVWHSSRRLPVDQWKWMTQIKGYCKGVGTNVVKMCILYLMGDYKGSGPQYKGYKIRFTDLEIEENWSMLTTHARGKGWIK